MNPTHTNTSSKLEIIQIIYDYCTMPHPSIYITIFRRLNTSKLYNVPTPRPNLEMMSIHVLLQVTLQCRWVNREQFVYECARHPATEYIFRPIGRYIFKGKI